MPQPRDDGIRRRMQSQKRRDTGAEMALRRVLHARGHRYRVDHRPEPSLRVRGDLVFTRRKVVVFVDGCFWHGCPEHATHPKNNAGWWMEKLTANRERDARNTAALQASGWTVIRVWEHMDAHEAAAMVESAIQKSAA